MNETPTKRITEFRNISADDGDSLTPWYPGSGDDRALERFMQQKLRHQ